jgi:hypothetical protein
MGNVLSKKRKERPSIIQPELPADNEYSNTTTTSINSILISQKQEAAIQQMEHNLLNRPKSFIRWLVIPWTLALLAQVKTRSNANVI